MKVSIFDADEISDRRLANLTSASCLLAVAAADSASGGTAICACGTASEFGSV